MNELCSFSRSFYVETAFAYLYLRLWRAGKNEGTTVHTLFLKSGTLKKAVAGSLAVLTVAATAVASTDTAEARGFGGGGVFVHGGGFGGFRGGYGFRSGFGQIGYGGFGYRRFGYGGFGYRRFGLGYGVPLAVGYGLGYGTACGYGYGFGYRYCGYPYGHFAYGYGRPYGY